MRRTFSRLLCATTPVAKVLSTALKTGAIAADLETLAQAKIQNLACWNNLPPTAKSALKLSSVAMSTLDDAAAAASSKTARPVWIAFGSQTGTAESYARMLGTYAVSHGFLPKVLSMDECATQLLSVTPSQLPDAILFVCSTYGTGEFPSNAKVFWKALSDDQLNVLSAVPHAVFGLGNSHNEHFNAAAKSLVQKLKTVGSPSLMRAQLSCELQANGHDAPFRTWKRAIWAALGSVSEATVLKPTYAVSECMTAKADVHVLRHGFIEATVHQNSMMTPKDYTPRVRLMRVSMDCEQQRRAFGRVGTITDHIEIYPRNNAALVARAVARLGVNPSMIVEVTPLPGAAANPAYDFKKMTVSTVLTEIVDLSAIPTRSVLETLSLCATSAQERERLENIAGDLSVGGLYDQLVAGVFTIVDALEAFPSIQLTLGQALTVLPHIALRSYSIASDNSDGNHASFEILYGVPTRSSATQKHQGLCSSMLDRSEPGERLAVRLVPSNIALPRDDAPCAVVALGTGIGSAHAILQHRYRLHKEGKHVGRTHLFYGMRHLETDCFFRSDFAEMQKAGFLTTTLVPSHDGPKFETPMDRFDASLVELLGKNGHLSYCGLGGSVPLVLESAMARVGLDVAAMRAEGRLHEEFFTVDVDSENLFKSATTDAGAATLAGRMGKCEMFCFQCEQTFKGKGCHKVGVCGKTPRVAALQDLTVHGAKHLGFYAHEIRQLGGAVPDAVNRFMLYSLFATLTNVNFDESRFVKIVRELHGLVSATRAQYEALAAKSGAAIAAPAIKSLPSALPGTADELVALGREFTVLQRFTDPATQNAAGVSEMLVYGLKGIAAYADHGLMNGVESQEIYAFMQKALAFLASSEQYDLGKGLALSLEAGTINVSTMGLLYQSNATLGVPTPTPVAVKPTPGKAILVSGHDLIILKGLLEKTEKLGINVYTHGEMLPAHSYPKLKAHKNLVGHFGGAWMRQSVEFPHFPGPVLMTTNCLTEPHETYRARIFTAGAVGWAGIPHAGNNMSDINFDALINAALNESAGFGNEREFSYADPIGTTRPASLTVGFGHETILSVAPTILEEIKKGTITRFFLVGGCDGYEGDRSYYTDLVAKLPPTAVVLTVGCGKYRFNYMDKGTIGDTGIPRILDMGQCNDSYSAVQVALALAKALNCTPADLPLSIVLSWFEQKAIAVLLSCLALGLKPVHVGPALPAFITPDVLDVLVTKFGVCALGDVNKDLEKMLAAPGAS
jgi:hydroxylamine reductase